MAKKTNNNIDWGMSRNIQSKSPPTVAKVAVNAPLPAVPKRTVISTNNKKQNNK